MIIKLLCALLSSRWNRRSIFRLWKNTPPSLNAFSFYFRASLQRPVVNIAVTVATRYIFKDWGIQRIQRAEVFARKSSQLRAKKEANGVEAFAYSTQETCSTGLTWPTASPFLSLSFSPRPSLSPFTLDSRKPTLGLRDTAARTQCYARCCYIASNPFVSPESLSLSFSRSIIFLAVSNELYYVRSKRSPW